jgi:hypothetical protein
MNPKSLANLKGGGVRKGREKLNLTLPSDVKARIKIYCVVNHTTSGELFQKLFLEWEENVGK